ncbi:MULTISPECIES: hypothetical protein [unclassified Mesorhizobium]|nr:MULTISPECIES: hypothetical protein [unclassified Mesorhizobium]ESX53193.1 hypothetical protein X760_30185 [Mesorhizobium sp. LSHC422A00]WJI42996.1 hypothetical protein NL532_20255 [Mesorhizobium sp. C120A]
MTKLSVLTVILVLLVSVGRCLSEGTQTNSKLTSEEAVKAASSELYSDILVRACRNGWRYPRSYIENGFRRHLAELKLQLVDQGYSFVPNMTANDLPVRGPISETKRRLVGSRQFSCSHPYWRDE